MASLSSKYHGEKVLVVPDRILREHLNSDAHFFPSSDFSFINELEPFTLFLDRSIAENDESYRQLIPYVLITRKKDGETEFFLFKRLSTQGEERLHNLYSLGAGGHINPADEESGTTIMKGLLRELAEELQVPDNPDLLLKGWIYSSIDPVSRVHAGMVFILDVHSDHIQIREKDKMTGEWCSIARLNEYYDRMEGWSRIVMDYLIIPSTDFHGTSCKQ